MSQYEHHPAAALFPMMDDFDLAELAADIKANGLLEPIVLFEGKILDGRNRDIACREAGVEPRFEDANGIGSPILYVVSKNLHRRHLTVSQRAAIAAEVAEMLRPEAKARQEAVRWKPGEKGGRATSKTRSSCSKGLTGEISKIAAAHLGVGASSVQTAINVRKADPVVFEKIKTGELTVPEAQRVIAGQPAKSTRQGWIEGAEKTRMVSGLSQIRGICVGLRSLKMKNLVLEDDERKLWRKTALDLSRELREFARTLGKEPNGKENQ